MGWPRRRFDEIGADLDARRQLIENAEEELVERERRLSLAKEAIRDRQEEIGRGAARRGPTASASWRASSTCARASFGCSPPSSRNEVTGSRVRRLPWKRRRACRCRCGAGSRARAPTRCAGGSERLQRTSLRQRETRSTEVEARAIDAAAKEQTLAKARGDLEPRLAAVKERERVLEERERARGRRDPAFGTREAARAPRREAGGRRAVRLPAERAQRLSSVQLRTAVRPLSSGRPHEPRGADRRHAPRGR